jgi:hypothetical protein
MAKAKKSAAGSDWKQGVSAAALISAVLGTLALGAVLQSDPGETTPGLPPSPPAVDQLAADRAVPDVARASEPLQPRDEGGYEPTLAVPFSGDDDLVDRAAADERRLQASGNGYTLQFAVNCEAKNVRANLNALERFQDFYLLTMLYQDRACFRLCWGFYDTEQQARSARDVPEALRSVSSSPKVISIAEALP